MSETTPTDKESVFSLLRKILVRLNAITGSSSSSSVVNGNTAIASGAASVAVTFSSAFASVPNVVAAVGRVTGDPVINGNIAQDSITVNGFTFELSATTDNANYKLNWMASV